MKENGRIVKNNCDKRQFDLFIDKIGKAGKLTLKNHKPATATVLQDRYSFSCGKDHISIVLETNSGTLVVTAPEQILKTLQTDLDSAAATTSPQQQVKAPSTPSKTGAEADARSSFRNNKERIESRHTLKATPLLMPSTMATPLAPTATPKAIIDKPIKSDKPEKLDKPVKIDKPAKSDRQIKQDKPTKLDNALKSNDAINPDKSADIKAQPKTKKSERGQSKPQSTSAPMPTSTPSHTNTPISAPAQQNTLQMFGKAVGVPFIQTINVRPPQQAKKSVESKRTKPANNREENVRTENSRAAGKTDKTEKVNTVSKVADRVEPLLSEELYKNGFALKKFLPEKLDGLLSSLKQLSGVTCEINTSEGGGKSYMISDGKNKVYLRYLESKQTLQLQGKRSKLFGEVQVLALGDSDYLTAVSSHIDLTGEEKHAKDMEKKLKKLLPDAFDLLSEQARIDITIGMMDIGSEDVKLSDYSMLLVPPYRGLERLIFDLQQAKDIDVKMIGQAYEKDASGGYVLKAGYVKKINSIVYAEVMSALYTEYFARRNFYAHSDITGDLLSRVITEKSAVKEIFANFAEVLNYNARKLKETNFKMNR